MLRTKNKKKNKSKAVFMATFKSDFDFALCTTSAHPVRYEKLLGEPGGQLTDVDLVPVCS